MIPIDNIFSLFGLPEDGEQSKSLKKDLEDFKESPYFKLGMFVKMVKNGLHFKRQIVSFFSKSEPELSTNGLDDAGDFMMYSRAWFWISQCKIRSKIWKEALKEYNNEDLVMALKSSIQYFEELEEYERCAFLKKIQDFLEKA
jgi:hypothetical protein